MTCSPDCVFGYFQSNDCSLDSNRVCKPYQYSAPEGLKYFIACGQVVSVGIFTLVVYKLVLEDLPYRSTPPASKVWVMFSIFIGIWDFVSDATMLALIEPYNPYGLFWISVSAIAVSGVASAFLAFYSRIKALLPVKVFVFVASCGNLFEIDPGAERSPMCFATDCSPELWNHIVILTIEQAPQLVVQCLLLYLQGIQGFSALDWAIWCQSATFTLLNAVKNIRQVLLARQSSITEPAATIADTQMEASSLGIAGAGICIAWGAKA